MYGDWFYTTDYGIFGHEVKATQRSPPDNLTRWIIKKSKGFSRKGIEKISRSVMAYVYLVLSSQIQSRSTIVGNSAPAVDTQQLFKDTFKSLINEHLSTDIEKYQRVSEHALSKVDFSVGIGRDRMKCLDLINKRLRKRNEARAYIKNVDEAMLEYYRVFAKKIKPLPPEPELSDFYHPSETQKIGQLLFVTVGTGIAT